MNIKNCIITLCLFLSSVLAKSSFAQSSSPIKCTLKGEVIDRPQSSKLLLLKEGEDPRINAVYIPINDRKFEYILNCEYEELYNLIFNDEFERGVMRRIPFFSENGIINFTLHPFDQPEKNIVEGDKLNREYIDYRNEILNKAQEFEPNKSIDEKVKQQINENGWLNAETYPLYLQIVREDLVYQEWLRWKIQYIGTHSNIVGYSILVSETMSEKDKTSDFSQFADVFQTVFAPKYPDHPYTAKMTNLLIGSSLKAGVSFIDFTTGDLTGKPVKLSERISGKPAVLHLWASWCGPCRKHGKELIPVYEEFRDKGFVVIGVARERNTPAAAEAAIKMDGYHWENLVELNDTEQIWNKYGVGNGGGEVFLIDEKGIIVAISPTVEEIRKFLLDKYK